MNNKKILTLKEVREFLFKKNFTIKKNKKDFNISDLRSIYLASIVSLLMVVFFVSLPMVINLKKNYTTASKEIINNSKSNFKKILDGDIIDKSSKLSKIDEGLNLKNLFDDVLYLMIYPLIQLD